MMKMVSMVLALLLLLSGCAVDAPPSVTTQSAALDPTFSVIADLKEFSRWLDSEGMHPGMSQGEFMELMAQYSYNGTPITELSRGSWYNQEGGGGFIGSCDFFEYENLFHSENGQAEYRNNFSANMFLDGLHNPFELKFGDTLPSVMEKFLFGFDPYEDFVSDDPSQPWEMTLYSDTNSRLYLINNKLKPDGDNAYNTYELKYTVSGTCKRIYSAEGVLTRSVTMIFRGSDDAFVWLVMEVTEHYPVKQE